MKLNYLVSGLLLICVLVTVSAGCRGRFRERARLMNRHVPAVYANQSVQHEQLQANDWLRRQILDNLAMLSNDSTATPSIMLPAGLTLPSSSGSVDEILSTYQALAVSGNARHSAAQPAIELIAVTDPRNLAAIQLELCHARGLPVVNGQPHRVDWLQVGTREQVPADCEFFYGQNGDSYVWVPQHGRGRLNEIVEAVMSHSTVPGEVAEQFVAMHTAPSNATPTLAVRGNVTPRPQQIAQAQVRLNPSDAFEQLFKPNLPLRADQQRQKGLNNQRVAHVPVAFGGVEYLDESSTTVKRQSFQSNLNSSKSTLNRIPVAEKPTADQPSIRKMSLETSDADRAEMVSSFEQTEDRIRNREKADNRSTGRDIPSAKYTRVNGFLIQQ